MAVAAVVVVTIQGHPMLVEVLVELVAVDKVVQ
jgi:hypothetical protein